jgi:predicted site-specific integrase-resolvase
MRDVSDVLTSFCARLFGHRGAATGRCAVTCVSKPRGHLGPGDSEGQQG